MTKEKPGLPPDPPGLLPMITVPDLADIGEATIVTRDKTGTYYRVTPEGYRRLRERAEENARIWKAHHDANPT